MKRNLLKIVGIALTIFISHVSFAQAVLFEWRLSNAAYSSVDPDGGGAAQGSTSFVVQVRALGAPVGVSTITVGWSYQDVNAMIPTSVLCTSPGTPSNVVISPAFAGWTYTGVNQCNVFAQTAGSRALDRRVTGTFESVSEKVIDGTWTDMFTVTLWSKNIAGEFSGYTAINSGVAGSPAPFGTYALSNLLGDEFGANSLTFTTPLFTGPVATPVLFTNYDVICGDKGAVVTWATATEINSSHFDIEKNTGAGWVTIGTVAGAGNSNSPKKYQYLDLEAGNAIYRVKQVDLDGRFVYTAQRNKSCAGRLVNVVLYPVPTSNILNVAIRTDKSIRTELQVFDMAGRIVKSQAASLNNGSNNLTINVAGLAIGEYILRSTDPTLQLNKKFTIAR
jgi:hypothetical protein